MCRYSSIGLKNPKVVVANMEQTLSRKIARWLIPALGVAALLACVSVYFFLMRTPHPPPALVLAACRDLPPGTHRINADFGTQFDVREKDFTIRSGMRDLPPGILHSVRLKDGTASMVIWHDDDIFNELKSAFPVFSEHVKERHVNTPQGSSVGKDRWGYLSSGERWRYVTFSSGDAVGYRPIRPEEASLLDQVISSACLLPARDH
jgi:hypothetical protein